MLEWEEAQLILQTVASLSSELPMFAPEHALTPSGTIYFRGLYPDTILRKMAPERIVKDPERTWYGMTELYVRDPDDHVICLGPPPAT